MYVINVEIQLNTQGPEKLQGLKFQFPFTHQPTVVDVLDAYDHTPGLYKRDDARLWRVKLVQALNTYGVPRLDAMRLTDGETGSQITTNMMRADWYCNMESDTRSVSSFPVGSIIVTRRAVIHNNPESPPAVAAKPVLPRRAKAVNPLKPKKEKNEKPA